MRDEFDVELMHMIRQAVFAELTERSRIDAETHYQHHQAIAQWVACSQQRRDIVIKLIQHVLGWGSVLGIGWLGKVLWEAAAASLRAGQ